MQITLVSSGDTVSRVLNQFETNFSLNWVEIKEEFSHLATSMSEFLIKKYSIRELKAMTDFLITAFKVVDLDAPKRNSKVSLAGWIEKVLLATREVAEASGVIADSRVAEVEVLQPEKAPVYEIALLTGDGRSTKAQVTQTPPYLVHDHRVFEKSSFVCAAFDVVYNQTLSEHLSDINEGHGQPIELRTDDLVVVEACVHGSPPPFIVNAGGVYKRMTWGVISWGKIVKYAQVVSEHLSNIVVVV